MARTTTYSYTTTNLLEPCHIKSDDEITKLLGHLEYSKWQSGMGQEGRDKHTMQLLSVNPKTLEFRPEKPQTLLQNTLLSHRTSSVMWKANYEPRTGIILRVQSNLMSYLRLAHSCHDYHNGFSYLRKLRLVSLFITTIVALCSGSNYNNSTTLKCSPW